MKQPPDSPAVRRRIPAADRRVALLDVALPIFAREGYGRASINDIAAATGVTKPVLYDHFGSKQGLYLAVLEREEVTLIGELMTGFDPDAGLDARLDHLARAAIRYVRGRPDGARVLLRTPDGDEVTRAAHASRRAQAHDLATALILTDPAFTASPGLSRAASASLQADLQTAALERLATWALDNTRAPAGAIAAAFVDLLWNGLAH